MPLPKYRVLAQSLAEDLRQGRFVAGARLPSVRQLCSDFAASLATVSHALHELEAAGLIEARPRQGFFVRSQALRAIKPVGVDAQPLRGRRKRLMALAATPQGLLPLSHLTLPESLLPSVELARLSMQLLREDPSLLARAWIHGSEALREQLALRVGALGCRVAADDIIVTHGEAESLQLCLHTLARPGEVVAVASPCSLLVLELLQSLGLEVLEIPSTVADGISLAALEFALKQRKITLCLLAPNFDSVRGSLMSDASKQQLADLLARWQLSAIELDMLGDLHHGKARPRPLKAFDHDERVIYCASFSCITGLGLGLGYVLSSRHRLQLHAARVVHGDLLPAWSDALLTRYLASGALEAHLRRLRRRLALQMKAYARHLRACFPPGTEFVLAEGAHIIWLTLPAGLDAYRLLERVRPLGLSFVPGPVFSLGRDFDACLRLTVAHPLDAERARALSELGRLACEMLAGRSPPA